MIYLCSVHGGFTAQLFADSQDNDCTQDDIVFADLVATQMRYQKLNASLLGAVGCHAMPHVSSGEAHNSIQ
jgi:hypothetical protein